MVYKWKVPLYKVSAQEAGEHIESLISQNGDVTPKLLVDDARPTDALLHPCFEWNNQKAAEKYRHDQAKTMISNLITVSIDGDKEVDQAPAFVNIKQRNESAHYQAVTVALSNEATREQVLRNAKAELAMFKRKYENLLNLTKILEDFLMEISA